MRIATRLFLFELVEDSADRVLRLDGDRRNGQVLIIDCIGSVYTIWPEVGLAVVMSMLKFRIILKILIVWPILLI